MSGHEIIFPHSLVVLRVRCCGGGGVCGVGCAVMLAKRVILSLTLNDGVLFRTKRFTPDYRYTLNFVDMELADEIVILDVTRDRAASAAIGEHAKVYVDRLFLPLAVGGGVGSIGLASGLLHDVGADKVVVNTEAFRQPEFITRISHKFGSQACVVSVDVKDWFVRIDQGREDTGVHVLEWAEEAVHRGAGEILLMDIDRDGSLMGMNLELIETVAKRVSVPVIAVGGCGNWGHMHQAFEAGADAVATQVIHHFTTPSLRAAKTYLRERGLAVRL